MIEKPDSGSGRKQMAQAATDIGTYKLKLPGAMTRRGFWLYVWRVIAPDGRSLHYVGRTGDNSSPYAAPSYQRMGQHLSRAENTNALRTYLEKKEKVIVENCDLFELIAHGPIYPEVERHPDFAYRRAPHWDDALRLHEPIKNKMAALEARLAQDLKRAGYYIMNKVNSNMPLDLDAWARVKLAFSEDFPNLANID
jgi:hypothetical protein